MAQTKTPPQKKAKRTYVLSPQILERFEAQIPPGKRGAAIDEAIDHWLEEQRREKIRAEMEEFYDDAASQALYLQLDAECSRASDEVWAQSPDEEWPEPAIVFPNGYAAYLAQGEKKESGGD